MGLCGSIEPKFDRMIALPSIAFQGFQGSAESVTARQFHGRTVLSLKSYPTGQATVAQVTRRSAMSMITKSYKTLSDEQMRAWARLAKTAHGQSSFGQPAELSAINLYVRLNVNRVMAGEEILRTPPEQLSVLPNVSFSSIWVTPELVVIKGIKHESVPLKLVVKVSAGQSAGVSQGWGNTVIVSPGMVDDWGDADVTKLYTKTLGLKPEVGKKVFFEFYWLDVDTGCTGISSKGAQIVMTEEEAEEAGMPVRLSYSFGDLNVEESGKFDALDIDFSTAAPVVYMESIFGKSGDTAAGEVVLERSIPTELTGHAFLVGRGNSEDGDLKPQSYLVYVTNRDGVGKMTFARRGGRMIEPTEVFGPAMLVTSN